MNLKKLKNKILQRTYSVSKNRVKMDNLSGVADSAEAFLERGIKKIRKGKM